MIKYVYLKVRFFLGNMLHTYVKKNQQEMKIYGNQQMSTVLGQYKYRWINENTLEINILSIYFFIAIDIIVCNHAI